MSRIRKRLLGGVDVSLAALEHTNGTPAVDIILAYEALLRTVPPLTVSEPS